jgi:hypothetical protein
MSLQSSGFMLHIGFTVPKVKIGERALPTEKVHRDPGWRYYSETSMLHFTTDFLK